MMAAASRRIGSALLLLLVAGCAQRATFRQLRPAELDLGLRRLAVLHLPDQRAEAEPAHAALASALAHSGGYRLVGRDELQRHAPAPLVLGDGTANVPAALEAARRLQADGLLVVQVRFVEADGVTYGTKQVRFGDPSVAAALSYELIDVRSGSLLDRNVAMSDYYKGELDPRDAGPESESAVLSRLAAECGAAMAEVLTPHAAEVEVRLAHSTLGPGTSEARKGVQAAVAGDWQQSLQHSAAAVEADPANDAALYNLGLAHEALGQFVQARRAYEAAWNVEGKSEYGQALERVQRAAADFRVAQMQRAGSSAMAQRAGGPQGPPQGPLHQAGLRPPAGR